MEEIGFPHKLIRLIKATLNRVKCCVKIQGNLSSYFETQIGLRQGDELSTKLFNIALEGVVRRSGVETRGSIFNKSVQILGYADDIDIIGRSLRAGKEAYAKLEGEAKKIGLIVNVEKTKFMMVSPSERTKSLVTTHFKVNDKEFEVVNDFVYLGSMINNEYNTSLEIKRRTVTAGGVFNSIRHLLTSKKLTRNSPCTKQ